MSSLSIIILTLNEAHNIEACLASAKLISDEAIVLDSYSQDATPLIASRLGAHVVQRAFDTYPSQRNAALELASSEWVFFLDADERATEALGIEVRGKTACFSSDGTCPVLYWVPRRNFIFGKWIRHTGWSPDYQPRLMRRDKVRFDNSRPVHELAVPDGGEGFLEETLLHLNYETLAQFRSKQRVYTQFEARMLFDQRVPARLRGFIGQPVREFARRYFQLEGYKDGAYGLALSLLMAYYAYVRQRTLRQLYERRVSKTV